MEHWARPLEDPDATAQQTPVAKASEIPQHRKVTGSGDEDPDIDPGLRGIDQRLEEPSRREEVRIGHPEPADAGRQDQVHHPKDPVASGYPCHDTDRTFPAGFGTSGLLISRKRFTGMGPNVGKGRIERRRRRTFDLGTGLPPWLAMPSGIAGPFVADTETPDKGDAAIDYNELPVVSDNIGSEIDETEGPEVPHLDALTPQSLPVIPRRTR
jgi:hypothetical protein